MVLPDLHAGVRRSERQPSHGPRRLQRRVARVEERTGEPLADRRLELVPPLRLEAVLAQSVELGSELVPFLLVDREAQAAGATQRIADRRLQTIEVPLRQPPVLACLLDAEPFARAVVRHRAAPKG